MPRPQDAEGPLQQPLLSWLIYSLQKNPLSSSVTLKRQKATERWIFKNYTQSYEAVIGVR